MVFITLRSVRINNKRVQVRYGGGEGRGGVRVHLQLHDGKPGHQHQAVPGARTRRHQAQQIRSVSHFFPP
jgi:hypothetical protein